MGHGPKRGLGSRSTAFSRIENDEERRIDGKRLRQFFKHVEIEPPIRFTLGADNCLPTDAGSIGELLLSPALRTPKFCDAQADRAHRRSTSVKYDMCHLRAVFPVAVM